MAEVAGLLTRFERSGRKNRAPSRRASPARLATWTVVELCGRCSRGGACQVNIGSPRPVSWACGLEELKDVETFG